MILAAILEHSDYTNPHYHVADWLLLCHMQHALTLTNVNPIRQEA